MPRSRSGSLDSLGRRRRRITSSYSHRRRRSVSISRSRSRSRSVSRGRRRDRNSRSRSRRRRSFSRSRSPVVQYHKTRSDNKRVAESKVEPKDKPNAMSHLSEEEQMRLLLGFGDFDSTKGKVVKENLKGPAIGTARQDTKREYRQYMNRRGGFNRPLDKV